MVVVESSLSACIRASLKTAPGATAALIVRLCWERLAGIYRLLVLYLLVSLTGGVLQIVFASEHGKLFGIYAASETLRVIAAIFVAIELFRLALVQQPALARFGRSMIGYIFAAAAILAGLNMRFGAAAAKQDNPIVGRFLAFERSMDLDGRGGFDFDERFPVVVPGRTRRNAAISIAGFVIYSFQAWVGFLLIDLWPDYKRQFSTAMLCVSLACLMAWIILLRRDGETTTVQTGHGWNPVEAGASEFELDAINTRLGVRDAIIPPLPIAYPIAIPVFV